MKAALSRPSDGLFEADCGEVQSKSSTEAVSGCSSWSNEKHMKYLSSLEDSFVSQLHESQFHLHLMNLLGRSRTNQRRSDSSITSETLSDASQLRTLQQRCREDLKFRQTKLGVQKQNASISLSENQWIKHFEPNFREKGANIERTDQQSVKREHGSHYSREFTSQAQPSFSSQNGDNYGEVSDQNFTNEGLAGAESNKKKRLNSPVVPPLFDQVVIEKRQHAIMEKG